MLKESFIPPVQLYKSPRPLTSPERGKLMTGKPRLINVIEKGSEYRWEKFIKDNKNLLPHGVTVEVITEPVEMQKMDLIGRVPALVAKGRGHIVDFINEAREQGLMPKRASVHNYIRKIVQYLL